MKVATWIGDKEEDEFVGVGARFGPTLESKEKDADKSRIALADRGNCSFTTKSNSVPHN